MRRNCSLERIAFRLLALVVIFTVSTSCSASGDGTEISNYSSPTAAPSAVSFDERYVETSLDKLLDQKSNSLALCLANLGFPELQMALDVVQPTIGFLDRRTLYSDPIESGPYLRSQAITYGMLGTRSAFLQPETAYVVSTNNAYDENTEQCDQKFDADRNLNTDVFVSDVSEALAGMRSEFVRKLRPAVSPLIKSRFDCMRNRYYETLTTDVSVSTADVLGSVGISPGQSIENSPVAVPSSAKEGINIVSPEPQSIYEPSADEVEFATSYVECGDAIGFTENWDDAQTPIIDNVRTEHRDEMTKFGSILRGALR